MIERNDYLQTLIHLKDKNIIKVVTGIRRCGKSTMFELYQNWLLQQGIDKSHIININLEDGDFRHIQDAESLYQYVSEQLTDELAYYVFLDEVQQVNEFQKAVDWLYVKKNIDLYITGSNAYLLSGELATLLSGRYIEIRMLPLSFQEYVSAFPDNSNIQQLYTQYLMNSSFPGTLELERRQDVRAYLEGIYHTILLKDVITRKKIADPTILESIVQFLFDNIGNPVSANKISGTLTSQGRKTSIPTVESYIKALQDSFILYKAVRYDIKGKEYLSTGGKYYAADIGLRYYLLGSKQADYGHILENIVYLELLRRGYEVYIGKVDRMEVDFIAVRDTDKEYYQVSLSVLDEATLQRELASLDVIKDHNPKYLLTMDYTPVTSYNGIKQINVLDWLLKRHEK